MMHQSEFDAANVALSRAADKRKSLINVAWVYEFAGLEPRIGLLEWTTGMDHWSGLLD